MHATRRSLVAVTAVAAASVSVALIGPGSASAAESRGSCPVPFHDTTLAQLLRDSGKDPERLTAFFEFVDANADGIICTKGLPVTPGIPVGSGIGLDNKAAAPADR
jgi:hypothetical protein